MTTTYVVETLRAGQPRAYADHENEYRITITQTPQWGHDRSAKPWLCYGDVEVLADQQDEKRAKGELFGGMSREAMRAAQRRWAVHVVRALCCDFREPGDQDGRTGMEAYFYPTLRSLALDPKAGTIQALIVQAFTD